MRHYGPSHIDYNNCSEARVKLLRVTKRLPSALRKSVIINIIKFVLVLICFVLAISGKFCAALRA